MTPRSTGFNCLGLSAPWTREMVEDVLKTTRTFPLDTPNGLDFRGLDLHGLDFSHVRLVATLSVGSDLSGCDLSGANLAGCYLPQVCFDGADLSDASLPGVCLMGASLVEANLTGANLSYVDLVAANLSGANLSGARLHRADLLDAQMWGTKLPAPPVTLPPVGTSFVGFKKVRSGPDGWQAILELRIPAHAQRVCSLVGSKCRASEAFVTRVIEGPRRNEFHSLYNSRFMYRVGETVFPDSYDADIRVECTNGVHFFTNPEEANDFHY